MKIKEYYKLVEMFLIEEYKTLDNFNYKFDTEYEDWEIVAKDLVWHNCIGKWNIKSIPELQELENKAKVKWRMVRYFLNTGLSYNKRLMEDPDGFYVDLFIKDNKVLIKTNLFYTDLELTKDEFANKCREEDYLPAEELRMICLECLLAGELITVWNNYINNYMEA